ncbi:MAG TPA: hypothetical protein PKD18_03880 [Saprospiraceae bacterium]|nr:hypothetical protein [Saprospiraceae bacterium]
MNRIIVLLILSGTFFIGCKTKQVMINDAKVFDKAGLPYYNMPAASEKYTAEMVVARMIDGLGFRFYWATDGLRAEDLSFRPTEKSRTSEETIDHIMGLSTVISNAVFGIKNVRSGEETSPKDFITKRKETLETLKKASDHLKQGKVKLAELAIVFSNNNNDTTFPFWNVINGPIADALWHVGQVVTFRRSSGNPFNGKANVLTGTVRE